MKISALPAFLAASLVKLYQKTLSPDHGLAKTLYPHGYCRFYPSCSEYAKQAILQHGLLKGLVLGFKRLLRCHPWAEPRVDNVPNS